MVFYYIIAFIIINNIYVDSKISSKFLFKKYFIRPKSNIEFIEDCNNKNNTLHIMLDKDEKKHVNPLDILFIIL